MAAQDLVAFFQSRLHRSIRRQRTWRLQDDILLMDLIQTSLQKPEALDEPAIHSLEFLRTIREILSHKTHDAILENLQYFRALADDNGTITDAFLAERPMRDWVQMLVEQILHAVVVKQETGLFVTIMSSLRRSASALWVAGSSSRSSPLSPRSPLSRESCVLSSPSKQTPSPMKSSTHPSSSQISSPIKTQPSSSPNPPLSPMPFAIPPPNITQIHLVGQNLRDAWLANEVIMVLIPPPAERSPSSHSALPVYHSTMVPAASLD